MAHCVFKTEWTISLCQSSISCWFVTFQSACVNKPLFCRPIFEGKMFICHLLLKMLLGAAPAIHGQNGWFMRAATDQYSSFQNWPFNLFDSSVLAMRVAHANNGFSVYFVNNRIRLYLLNHSTQAAAKLRFHLQNKLEIIICYLQND